MLDDKGHPIIIDFNSCAGIGKGLDEREAPSVEKENQKVQNRIPHPRRVMNTPFH